MQYKIFRMKTIYCGKLYDTGFDNWPACYRDQSSAISLEYSSFTFRQLPHLRLANTYKHDSVTVQQKTFYRKRSPFYSLPKNSLKTYTLKNCHFMLCFLSDLGMCRTVWLITVYDDFATANGTRDILYQPDKLLHTAIHLHRAIRERPTGAFIGVKPSLCCRLGRRCASVTAGYCRDNFCFFS